jgi:tetratricopeptide (TPR) repeat protein
MEWICSCKTSNEDLLNKCSNCGRKKPKYFGIKVDFKSTSNLNDEKLSLWYLQLAIKYLKDAQERLNILVESRAEIKSYEKVQEHVIQYWEKLKNLIKSNCQNCFLMLDEAEKLDQNPGFEDEDNISINLTTVKSKCHYVLGSFFYNVNQFEEAVNNFQNSFDLDPNQFTIFQLALSTIKLPVEGTSVFSSKKTSQAIENKKQQEIDLLLKTIKFSPFSDLGLKSAQILNDNYNYRVSLQDIK